MPDHRYDDDEVEIDLIEVCKDLWRRKGFIFLITFLFGAVATAYAFLTPFTYRAECRVLPPQSVSVRMAGIAAQLGGLADFVGLPGMSTSGATMVEIMKGDSVVDAIIDKFHLMEELSEDIRLNARKSVLAVLEANEDTKSGIVSVAYIHKDPVEAADIANAFVDELQKKMQEIAVQKAIEQRSFFENQLIQAQQELNQAEEDMMNYQQSSGVIALEKQTETLIASIAQLRSQIATKNVEVSSLRSYARKDNPQLRLAQSQLEAMNKELRRLEEEQRRTGVLSGDLLSSIGRVPELGVEYQRYVRALRFANAKYELMLRQYENAKLSEASDLSTLSIVDKATPPDWKYKPKRGQIMMIGTMLGFFLGAGWVFITESMKKAREAQEDYD